MSDDPTQSTPAEESASPAGSGDAGASFPTELREGVRRRDPVALERLFEAWFPEVYDFACRMLGDRTLAEDVTQEVFLKVYRHADRYDPGRDPGPWIITITVNTCRDHWRSRGHQAGLRSRPVDDEAVAPKLVAEGPDPESASARAQEARRVQEALLRLPEEKRSVILLHDYRGWTHERIAEALDLSPAAVRKRYSRALAELRPLLKDLER